MPDETVVHIIDDDDAVREFAVVCLRQSGDQDPHLQVASPFPGIASRPHAQLASITDIRMPEMTGDGTAAAAERLGQKLPVIVITGHGDVALAVEAMRLGADRLHRETIR